MGDQDLDQRIRLVTLGGYGVGKTSVIKRFLFNSYVDKHKPTVEDLYYREYDLGGSHTVKVDLLDTAGDLQFPAMRRLSIANANAFLLVYSIDDLESFNVVKQVLEEIKEQRADFQEIPIVVAGNKMDLSEKRQVPKEDVAEWLFCELPKLKTKVVECSAKDGTHVRDVFRSYIVLSDFNRKSAATLGEDAALRRRSSAYGSIHGGRLSPNPVAHYEGGGGPPEDDSTGNRLKPRSRSLIRRSSKKSPKMGRANMTSPDGCAPS